MGSFFDNLLSGAKSFASDLTSGIKNTVSNIGSFLGAGGPAAISQPMQSTQPVYPPGTQSVAGGRGVVFPGVPATFSTEALSQPGVTIPNTGGYSAIPNVNYSPVRPLLPVTPQNLSPQQQATFNPGTGIINGGFDPNYYDSFGNPLRQAPSGQAGVTNTLGGGNAGGFTTSPTGASGTPGAFVGFGSGGSGLGTPSSVSTGASTTDEQLRQKRLQQTLNPTTGAPTTNPQNNIFSILPGNPQFKLPIQPTPTPFKPAAPTGSLNVSQYQPTTITDKTTAADLNQQHETNVNDIVNQLNSKIPQTPVQDTPEQLVALQALEAAKGVDYAKEFQGQMDSMRASLGLPDDERKRLETLNLIDAAQQSFKKITDDIKYNPELPKGLAQRRIEEFSKINDQNIQIWQNQLGIINQQIQDKNAVLNRQFDIYKMSVSAQQQAKNDAQQNLKTLITTGALASATADQLKQYATQTGMSGSDLLALRAKASEKTYANITTKENAAGDVTFIGIGPDGKPNVLGTIKGIGTPSSTVNPAATVNGVLTKEEVGRLGAAGVSPDVYTQITRLLLNGVELDKIRDIMRQAGEDPKLLDAYDRAVGIENVRKIPGTKTNAPANPFG